MTFRQVSPHRLADFKPFSDLTSVQQIFLSHLLEVKLLAAGQKIIISKFDLGMGVFLLEGTVRLEPESLRPYQVLAGDAFSQNSLLNACQGRVSIIAETNVEYFIVSAEHLNYLKAEMAPSIVHYPEVYAGSGSHPIVLDFYRELEKNNVHLPSLPELAQQISKAISDENLKTQDLSRLISSDPNLAARLMKMANSPFYRGLNEITHIFDAITRLGLDVTRNLVIAFAIREQEKSTAPLWIRKLLLNSWRQSIQLGALCYVLAQYCERIAPEEALLAGLLHNIGELPLIVFAAQYPEFEFCKDELLSIVSDNRSRVGSIILQEWNLPEALVTAVQNCDTWFYEPYESGPVLTDIVIVARAYNEYLQKDLKAAELPRLESLPSYFKLCGEHSDGKLPDTILDNAREQIGIMKALLST
ncbi:HDOD domain-containing protein [Oceanospirillum sediminis]|uniref:HDOD domain-containing protein n=1 Tax=Oceanospirillum sediminis TaxID=2760088 RepID=A0A839ITE1_9GAMM|nr:HDOD domain-containing protein [Oceanospirillum sediminis]MBB1487406.1 HDOD domain-containing protein [Oceanospirillum sediminis]